MLSAATVGFQSTMPLEKRRIEPCELSRKKLEDGLRNELEAVAVNTLCGIMRQLSGLSKHAEDVFGELCNEANGIYERTNSLHERVQNLSMKVTQLDSTVEESKWSDIYIISEMSVYLTCMLLDTTDELTLDHGRLVLLS